MQREATDKGAVRCRTVCEATTTVFPSRSHTGKAGKQIDLLRVQDADVASTKVTCDKK